MGLPGVSTFLVARDLILLVPFERLRLALKYIANGIIRLAYSEK